MIGIPSNADQHMSTAVLEENGAGLGVREEEASEERLYESLKKLLVEPQYRRRAQEWASVFARYNSRELFSQFLDGALADGEPARE